MRPANFAPPSHRPSEQRLTIAVLGLGPTLKDVKVPKTAEEARRIIDRFEAGADRPDEVVADNVGQHALADETKRASS